MFDVIRSLLVRLHLRRSEPPIMVDSDFAPWTALADATPLMPLLEEIEQTALAVYGFYDLPTVPGHYGRSPRAQEWQFLDDALTAEERFALVIANPKWRFSTLENLGKALATPSPDLAAASDLLAGCATVRSQLRSGSRLDASNAEACIRLGADWRSLEARLLQLKKPTEPAGQAAAGKKRGVKGATESVTLPEL